MVKKVKTQVKTEVKAPAKAKTVKTKPKKVQKVEEAGVFLAYELEYDIEKAELGRELNSFRAKMAEFEAASAAKLAEMAVLANSAESIQATSLNAGVLNEMRWKLDKA